MFSDTDKLLDLSVWDLLVDEAFRSLTMRPPAPGEVLSILVEDERGASLVAQELVPRNFGRAS